MQGFPESEVLEAAVARLLAEDPLLRTWNRLSPPVQQRESYFLKNSVRGFVGYLADRKGSVP
jgi:hypothetical protein